MVIDQLSMNLMGAAVILGFLTLVIVGSQDREDARSVAAWTLGVLVPMLLVSGAIVARPGGFHGGPGMVAICSALIVAVGLGYRIAASRDPAPPARSKDKEIVPGLSDDELA